MDKNKNAKGASDEKTKQKVEENASNNNENTSGSVEPSRAKKRWKALLGRIGGKNPHLGSTVMGTTAEEPVKDDDNLIEEIKRMKKKKQARSKRGRSEGILSILHSHHDHHHANEKVYEKQKISAKERILKRRVSMKPSAKHSIADIDNAARLRYPITEIRIKLEKIKCEAEREEEKHEADAEQPKTFCKRGFDRVVKWLSTTNFGETFRANHRFYKMDPRIHLPDFCRRCRRPLAATLEAKFTSIGILFALLLPIIGILLLYANQEFTCVVCNELYVYGDLTARPIEDYESDGEEAEA